MKTQDIIAECRRLAAEMGPGSYASISVGSEGLAVHVRPAKREQPSLCDTNCKSFDDALDAVRRHVDLVTANMRAADLEFASWFAQPPVMMAAE